MARCRAPVNAFSSNRSVVDLTFRLGMIELFQAGADSAQRLVQLAVAQDAAQHVRGCSQGVRAAPVNQFVSCVRDVYEAETR